MRPRSFDIIFSLALFALYTTVALALAAVGARVYVQAGETLGSNYQERTSVLYVAQRLRQNDVSGQVRADHLGEGDALVFTETAAGMSYETWLYVYDGQLCELLVAADRLPDPALGQPLMPMQAMQLADERFADGLVTVLFTMPDGQTSRIAVYLRSLPDGWEEVAP